MLEQVTTVDQATQEVRRWPDRACLRDLVTILRHESRVAIPKSRRVMATWTVAMHCLHLVSHHPHHLVLWLSRIEETAAATVDGKMAWAARHLVDPRMRRAFASHRTSQGKVGRMMFQVEGGSSEVVALASGADVVRSYTASVIVFDESEFQGQAWAALAAIEALLEEGKAVQVILLSSSNGPTGPLAAIAGSVGFTKFR